MALMLASCIYGEKENPQADTESGTVKKKQSVKYPYEVVLYYEGKGGDIDPSTPFSMCSMSQQDEPSEVSQILPIGAEMMSNIKEFDPATNPTMPLSDFPMDLWRRKYKISRSEDDATLSISNKGSKPLNVTLPKIITMPLYVSGDNVVLNDVRMGKDRSVVIGIDPRTYSSISSGVFPSSDHIVPSSVIVNKLSTKSTLLIRSKVDFNNGSIPQWLGVYHSEVLSTPHKEKGHDQFMKRFAFYGNSSLTFKEKPGRITGDVSLETDDTLFRTDPSAEPNNSIADINNVVFEPRSIDFDLPVVPNKGFFNIKGSVDLTHTKIVLGWRYERTRSKEDSFLDQRILMITADRPIVGKPGKIRIQEADPSVGARVEID